MPDDPASLLSPIRERAEGPMRKFGDVDASQRDVPRLLAAVDAALNLADEWEAGTTADEYAAQFAYRHCAGSLRAAITTALAGEEAGDG